MNAQTKRLTTVGVRPTVPTFFWDFDKTDLAEIRAFAEQTFFHYDIYESSPHRYHLVAAAPTHDSVQNLLRLCKNRFPHEVYIMHCRRLRLRITPKWDASGSEVVQSPMLLECHCVGGKHIDKRVGITEVYFTK